MIQNYFKMAWRNMVKDKQFTVLNIIGLAIGITCTLLIYLWVLDEMSFDKFFARNESIYQLMERRKTGGDIKISDESSGILGETLAAQMPEIEYAAAVAPADWFQQFTLSSADKNVKASGQYAGKDYFSIFSFKLLSGQKKNILADKNSIVISDELAKKLFGTTDGITGKPVRFQHEKDFFVSGVFQRTPYHSSQQFDFVLSFEYYKDTQSWVKNWNSTNTGPHNFVLLKKGTDINAFNRSIAGVITRNSGDTTRSVYASRFADNYLLHTFSHGAQTDSKRVYVKLFSLIAIFILLIACINFMNLSTAKASRRMKEVGVKKVIGARKYHLVLQFFSESLLITTVSMLLSLVLVTLTLPWFNNLTGKQIVMNTSSPTIIGLILITLFTGLFAGSYPALYLSGFKPLNVLKNMTPGSAMELFLRKGLVVLQFTLSVILIISVLVINNQVQYIQSADPGYAKENIIRFDSEGTILGSEESFIAGLKKLPGVVNASFTFNNIIGRNFGTPNIEWEGKTDKNIFFEGFGGGYDFVQTMGLHILRGRNFSSNYGDELSKVLVNETAVKTMHMQNPVGKTIRLFGRDRQIIGVIRDFHFESLHKTIGPAYLTLLTEAKNPWHKIIVKIKPGQQAETIDRIQQYYSAYNPGFPFSYNFLDDAYRQQYLSEIKVSSLSRYFSGLAILISCLGLFGLAAFTAQKKQKEIGIRKVVGASAGQIAIMLSTDFLRVVIISILVAFPIAWWAMHIWLNSFAYRVSLHPGFFALGGSVVILISLFTVSYQAIRSAVANPVKSLRTD